MGAKKILLPESPLTRERKTKRTRPSSSRKKSQTRNNRPTRLVSSARQRNEAIGLLMIGLSAFCLSLTHYLSSSKVSQAVNFMMVQFGMGVYIFPLLLGLMGFQKFLERPFENYGWRIGGGVGVMAFGLGLLGMEGGKLGISFTDLFARHFGAVPTKVLFFFMFLSSLIFALDILYKDVLATGVILAGLTTRLILFAWEVLLALVSMLIEAVKTTLRLVSVIYARVRGAVAEHNPAEELGRLISFKPEKPVKEQNDAAADRAATNDSDSSDIDSEEEATIIPAPRIWQDINNENSQPQLATEVGAVQFNSIASSNLIVTEVMTQSTNSVSSESGSDEDEELEIIVELEETQAFTNHSPTPASLHTPNGNLAPQLSVGHNAEDEPVHLEDNLIDMEIRNSEHENIGLPLNPHLNSKLPSLDLLKQAPPRDNNALQSDLSRRSAQLLKTLDEFGVKASISDIVAGPAVSRFELKPAPGVKVARITALADDIAMSLAAHSIRIEAPIPGKPALGIEIPNCSPTPVYFYDLLKNDRFAKVTSPLNLALGVTISGKAVFADLTDMPHLLIAGSTGSGKSVCVNTIIASILYQSRADQVKFVMIDPKMVELSTYNGIPHLIAPVVTDPAKAASALMWAVEEMERRYEILAGCGVRKISSYNEELKRLRAEIDSDLEHMPFIVIIIDELADLMMTASAEVEGSICRLAQMARAVGIHLVIATQRPSVNVLTGIIKANLPTRIAFSVTSAVDSRTILDAKGAESLLGKGDMLFIPKGRNKPLRLQGAFISDRELNDITEFVKSQGQPDYMEIAPENVESDAEDEAMSATDNADAPLIDKITTYLVTQEKTSTSMLQRKFRIGYNRAARIMDQLEEDGMVTPMDGVNKRRVLIGRSNTQV